MSSASKEIFEDSLKRLNKALDSTQPGLSVETIIRSGEFEQALFMLWVSSRVYFFEEYLPGKRRDRLREILTGHPLMSGKESKAFTPKEVINLIEVLSEPIATALSSMRQGQTSIRGALFEYIMHYPINVLLHGKMTSKGKNISVIRTPKKKQKENIDLTVMADDTSVIGISVKGNLRERLRESVQRATNAVNKGYFSYVWHCTLTVGDDADKEALYTAMEDPMYTGHQIYTWRPLCRTAKGGYPRGARLIPFGDLPENLAKELGL